MIGLKTYLALPLLLTTFWYRLSAQEFTLSGFVRDAGNGEDLIGATIQLGESGSGTTTNAYGFFALSVPAGTSEIKVSYLGYETLRKTIDVTADAKIEFELAAAAQELNEIVVSSVAEDENVRSAQVGVEKLPIETILKVPAVLGETDILKTLTLLPGVSSIGEGTTGFNVRGGGADQNLILLDEATIYNASHLLGFFSVFNADAIKDVQLYKGGIPARFGGRLSSVLEVWQREGNKKEFSGSAGIGLIASRLKLEGPLAATADSGAKGSWMIAGRRSYADLFLKLTEDFKDDVLYFYDLNAKVNYSLGEKDRIFLSGYFGRDRLDLAGLLGNSWGNRSVTLRWNHLYSDRLFGNLSATSSLYDYSLKSLRPGTEFEWTSEISNASLRKDFNFFLNNNNELNFGLEANYSLYRPGSISPINDSPVQQTTYSQNRSLELAAYLSNEFRPTPWLAINYGLRYSLFYRLGPETVLSYQDDRPAVRDQNGAFVNGVVTGQKEYRSGEAISTFDGWEPRLSARLTLSPNSSVKAGFHRMYQYVHLISNTTSSSPLDIWSPSGPYKDPQRADQVSLGYFRNLADNKYEFSVEGYYKWLDDLVDFVDGAQLLFSDNLETELLSGTGRAYGLEVLLRKKKGQFNGWLSYTLSRSERRVAGINNGEYYPSNYDKTHDLSLTGIFEWSDRVTLSANFVFATGRPVTYPTGKYEYSGLILANYGSRNQDRLPDYHRLDLSVTLRSRAEKRWAGQWIFSLYNAYNRMNAADITFRERAENDAGREAATGISEAVRLSYFGIVPGVTYEVKF